MPTWPGGLPFLSEGPVPPWCSQRVVTITAETELAYMSADWTDALVVVIAGTLVLEGLSGSHTLIENGDVLWLQNLDLRALVNHGPDDAVLVAIWRATVADAGCSEVTGDLDE
jgi:quercetin dioxygenase-like cupin family protein